MNIKEKLNEKSKIIGKMTFTLRNAETGEIESKLVKRNIVVTVGRAVIAARLAGNTTYSGTINYGALGTNTATPANADTQLGTETFRKAISSYNSVDNIAYLSFFYTATEVTGTFKEFGNFIDGSAAANSGQLFTHVAIDITKTSSQTLTVDCEYEIL